MSSNIPIAPIPFPPTTYDHRYFNETIKVLNLYFRQLQNPGVVVAYGLQLTNLYTSATGLPPGTVWRDTADNTLKVVPIGDVFVVKLVGISATGATGTVTP